jgi:hypothetical protein
LQQLMVMWSTAVTFMDISPLSGLSHTSMWKTGP